MANVVDILIKAKDDASKAFDKAQSSGAKFTQGLRNMRGPLLGVVAGIGGLAIVGVKAASDLEESMNKAMVTFGSASGKVTQFAATSARDFGISKAAANEYAGTLGTILNASGLTQDASADMSVGLVKLAADLASFNNIPIDVALKKLQSGLVGEVEPLRQVGVLLSEVVVAAKAVELGLIEQGGAMTDQIKVQARYAAILDQTKTSQGDFARTSDSLANQMRIVTASLTDAAATMGVALLPMFTKAIQTLNKGIQAFMNLSPAIKTAIVAALAFAGGLAVLGLAIPIIVTGVGALVTILGLLLSPIGLVVVAIVALVVGAVFAFTKWRDHTEEVIHFMIDLFTLYPKVISMALDLALEGIRMFVNGMIASAEYAINILSPFEDVVLPRIGKFTLDLSGLVDKGIDAMKGLTDKGIDKAGDAMIGFADKVRGAFDSASGAFEAADPMVDGLNAITTATDNAAASAFKFDKELESIVKSSARVSADVSNAANAMATGFGGSPGNIPLPGGFAAPGGPRGGFLRPGEGNVLGDINYNLTIQGDVNGELDLERKLREAMAEAEQAGATN